VRSVENDGVLVEQRGADDESVHSAELR
jgi:hypothetical protein